MVFFFMDNYLVTCKKVFLSLMCPKRMESPVNGVGVSWKLWVLFYSREIDSGSTSQMHIHTHKVTFN